MPIHPTNKAIPADIKRVAFLILSTTTGLNMLPHDQKVLEAKIAEALLEERERVKKAIDIAFDTLQGMIRDA